MNAKVYSITKRFGYFDKTAKLTRPHRISAPNKIYMYSNTNINEGATLILSPRGENGRFIMNKNSGSAANLTVVTGNHNRQPDYLFKDKTTMFNDDVDLDVIVDEEVWIGANVTLMPGAHISRGCTVGAGSIIRGKIPPYAVVIGNPAKIVGFNFTPEEVVEHEKKFYAEQERLPLDFLEKNYKKYFLDHIKEIKAYSSIICK